MNIKDSYIHNGEAILKDILVSGSKLQKLKAGKDANDAYLTWVDILDLTPFGASGHNHDDRYLKLTGGTLALGEGLKFHADENYFGTNLDARIISLLDGNGTTCDGGLIIDERATSNGVEHVTELLRIRDSEFKWKGNDIYHTNNLSIKTLMGSTAIGDADEPVYWNGNTFVKASAYPTKASWNYDDVYLKLSGGILTGDLRIKFGDTDKFIMWDYDGDNTAGASWRIGAKGTGSGNANYFCIESGTNGPSISTWNNVLNIGQNDFTVYFSQTPKVGSTNVSLEGHTHTTSLITNFPSSLPANGGNADGLILNEGGFTVPAAGWYKLAYIKSTDARGSVRISIFTTGGSYIPEYTELKVANGWSIIDFTQFGKFDWIDAYRYTVDSTYSYIEARFTGPCDVFLAKIKGIGSADDRNTGWTLYKSAVAGTDTTAQIYTRYRYSGIYSNNIINGTGFVKTDSSDNYVLLGGGGHKLESNLSVSSATYASNVGTSGTAGTNYVTASKVIATCNWYDTMIGTDSDKVINRWSEIVDFVAGFEETPDLATFLSNNYLAKSGGTMTGDITFSNDNKISWSRNTDTAEISFKNNGNDDSDSYMLFQTTDDNNEYFKWRHINYAGTSTDYMNLKSSGLSVLGSVTSSGFKKSESDDSYVLLGGGGHKALSDFMSSTIKYALSDSIGGKALLSYKLCLSFGVLTDLNSIDNFHEALTFKYTLWNANADSMKASYPGAENGIILSGGWTSATYGFLLAIDDDPNYFIALRQRGNGTWAAWKRIPMGDGTGASGTWNISISGNATTATSVARATFGDGSNGTHDANAMTSNGLYYYNSNGPLTTAHNFEYSDGSIYVQAHSTSWVNQIAQDYRSGKLAVRSKNNGTWQPWRRIAFADSDYIISADRMYYEPEHRKFTRTASGSNWDTQAYSVCGYKECRVTYKISQTNAYIMVGLNSDPTTDASYSSIDYCWYTQYGGGLEIYENGTGKSSISGHTTYAAGDELIVEYSCGQVRYYHNGVLCRTVARTYGSPLYFDCSFHQAGSIENVVFEPIHDGLDFVQTTATYSLSNAAWTNTISLPSTAGSYILNITSGGSTLTGVFSIGTSDSAKDEISLHLHGNGPRLYARTNGTTLLLSSSDTNATSRSVTIKYRRMI